LVYFQRSWILSEAKSHLQQLVPLHDDYENLFKTYWWAYEQAVAQLEGAPLALELLLNLSESFVQGWGGLLFKQRKCDRYLPHSQTILRRHSSTRCSRSKVARPLDCQSRDLTPLYDTLLTQLRSGSPNRNKLMLSFKRFGSNCSAITASPFRPFHLRITIPRFILLERARRVNLRRLLLPLKPLSPILTIPSNLRIPFRTLVRLSAVAGESFMGLNSRCRL